MKCGYGTALLIDLLIKHLDVGFWDAFRCVLQPVVMVVPVGHLLDSAVIFDTFVLFIRRREDDLTGLK